MTDARHYKWMIKCQYYLHHANPTSDFITIVQEMAGNAEYIGCSADL